MATEIRVPTLGESVSEATIGRWFKKPGDAVKADEPLVELETDKVTLEVNAPAAGTLGDIARQGRRDGGAGRAARLDRRGRRCGAARRQSAEAPKPAPVASAGARHASASRGFGRPPRRLLGGALLGRGAPGQTVPPSRASRPRAASTRRASPERGKDGRVTKGDMLAAIARGSATAPAPRTGRAGPGARAVGARRRVARGARAHDEAAPDHRAPPQGCAEHRRHADDVQRRRHERGDGAAQPVQGRVREEARREARLHGLLHEGGACRR